MFKRIIGRFKFVTMPVTIERSAQISTFVLLIVTIAIAVYLTHLTPLDCLILGLLMTALHWLGELLHQYGHYLMAEYIGKPATGTRLWWVLSITEYPSREQGVTPTMHIRRAIGGPIMSLFVLVGVLILAILFWNTGESLRLLLGWIIFEHVTIFVGGALMPLRMGNFSSDGGTILYYLRQQGKIT